MSSNISIALLTRFSVRSSKFMKAAGIEDEAQRDNWFIERAKIFKSVTLPSIRNQVVRPDVWYLLFASGDEDLYEKNLQLEDEWIKPLFIPAGAPHLSGFLHSKLARDIPSSNSLLLSRIDNDDALDGEYFDLLRRTASQLELDGDLCLLFRDGYRWDGDSLQQLDYPNNPFITILSKNWRQNKPSPLAMNHSEVLEKKHEFVTPEPRRPMWLQTLNGSNASNRFWPNRGSIQTSNTQAVIEQFRMDADASDTIRLATANFNLVEPAPNMSTATSTPKVIAADAKDANVSIAPPQPLDPKTARARRLNAVAARIEAKSYLEIGVCTGSTFLAVNVDRKVGVDPRYRFDTKTAGDARAEYFHGTSNEYFLGPGARQTFDLIFIDGLHTFEQTLIDFNSCLMMMHEGSVILVDDTVPNDVFSSVPTQRIAFKYRAKAGSKSLAWHGDTFKLIAYIHDFLPMLSYCTFNSGGNQQTLVWRHARENFNPILRDVEKISRIDYFWLMENFDVLNAMPEPEAIDYFSKRYSR
jgi:predicted O-methyltransferase YrrM